MKIDKKQNRNDLYLYNIYFTVVHSNWLIMNNEKKTTLLYKTVGRKDIDYVKRNFTNSPNQSGKFNNQRPLLILIIQKGNVLNLFYLMS